MAKNSLNTQIWYILLQYSHQRATFGKNSTLQCKNKGLVQHFFRKKKMMVRSVPFFVTELWKQVFLRNKKKKT